MYSIHNRNQPPTNLNTTYVLTIFSHIIEMDEKLMNYTTKLQVYTFCLFEG